MSFPGTGKIWMNGKLVEWKDATIHIASHVIHYGSGVFEGARCYATPKGSACFRLDEHLIRLVSTRPRSTGWSTRSTSPAGARPCSTRSASNEMKACYIRPLVYRGYDTLGVNPLPNPVDAAIMVWEWGAYLGAEALEEGVDVKVVQLDAHGAEHAAGDGQGDGQLRQLRAHQDGGAGRRLRRGHRARRPRQRQRGQRPEHLHRPRRRHLHAAAARRRCSAASRATTVITLARDLGYTVVETNIPREALYIADEVFFVGTAAEVTPIRSIDKITIGARPPRPDHRGAPAGVLRRHQRRGAGHPRLADLRLPRRSRTPASPCRATRRGKSR